MTRAIRLESALSELLLHQNLFLDGKQGRLVLLDNLVLREQTLVDGCRTPLLLKDLDLVKKLFRQKLGLRTTKGIFSKLETTRVEPWGKLSAWRAQPWVLESVQIL